MFDFNPIAPSSTSYLGKTMDPLGLFQPGPAPRFDSTTTNLANLSFQQYQQAIGQLYPTQNQLIKYAEDPSVIANARSQAIKDTDTSFATNQAGLTRGLSNMGVTTTPDQKAALAKSEALSKGLSEAADSNVAAQMAYQTQQGVLQGFGH